MTGPRRRHTKLLVLDLDETLIHARDRDEPDLPWPPDRQIAQFRVYLRPGAREFMTEVLARFVAVGVWTSATRDYAIAMLGRIVDRSQLRFLYDRSYCIPRRDPEGDGGYWVKDLTRLGGFGFEKSQILVVDDKPRGLERSYANLIKIPPFEGDPDDDALERLLDYLEELGPVEDVRRVEKREWWR